LVYSPIEDWTDDDVWVYLMQQSNPWGYQNKDLLTMYQGATEDGECPLVVDSSTPSCGDSRFGCWTCTLVDQDKSMAAMIQNDDEKEWMLPLLEIRNALDVRNADGRRDDTALRDFRRMNGRLQLFHAKSGDEEQRETLVHGPYTQTAREDWLRRVLDAQVRVRGTGPEEVSEIELISDAELVEIRRIWIKEKHEFEDRLPTIFEEVTGERFTGPDMDEHVPLGSAEVELLKEICGEDQLHFEMVRELLDIERQNRTRVRRAGLFESLEKAISKSFFDDSDDAFAYALNKRGELEIGPREEVSVIDEFIEESEPKEGAEA
jgi:DNA sulfur modification protein DndC